MYKKLLLSIFCVFAIANISNAQFYNNVDLESAGLGASWSWIMDNNDDNPPLEFIANPVSGSINTSATVAKFTARVGGEIFALIYTDDIEEFTFSADNNTIKIMVYKSVISDVAMKFEGSAPTVEIKIANTLINQWEEITYDFSASIGNTYNRMVVVPDFQARAQDNILYLDNIQIPVGDITALPVELSDFRANSKEEYIELNWLTHSEVNNDYFEIEHSRDGNDFKVIGMVDGNNTATEGSNYYFKHLAPIGMNYYRLRQVDLNGDFDWSNIISAERRGGHLDDVKIYPVPVRDRITIDYTSTINEKMVISFIDVMGRTITTQSVNVIEGINQFSFNFSEISKGNYFIKLHSIKGDIIRRVVKN